MRELRIEKEDEARRGAFSLKALAPLKSLGSAVALATLVSLSSFAAPDGAGTEQSLAAAGPAAAEAGPGLVYVGAAGVLTLPQGGSRLRRLGGAAVRGGAYLSDFWAVEGDVAWQEDAAGLGVDALAHVQAWPVYGDLFGYSAFDPFVTAGARGWIGARGAGQVGPQLGLGAFWHLDDRWSLRADANATLGLDSDVEAVYSLAVGVQFGF